MSLKELGEAISHQSREIWDFVSVKAFFASLPIAYSAHFLGEWHLVEIWFFIAVIDLFLGILLSRKNKNFSWRRVHAWSFKILIHSCTIIAVGVIAHAASIAATYDVLILNMYVFILIAKELSSLARNAHKLGWPIPTEIFIILSALRKKQKEILESKSESLKECDKDKDRRQ